MTNIDNNPKSLSNFNDDAVDGKNVMGGGFGDGFVDDGTSGLPADPFQAPAFNGPEDPIGGGMGPMDNGDPNHPTPIGPEHSGPHMDSRLGPTPLNSHGPI